MTIDCTEPPQRTRPLRRRDPLDFDDNPQLAADFSASAPLVPWQRRSLLAFGVTLIVGAIFVPRLMLAVLFSILIVPFLCIIALRTSALVFLRFQSTSHVDLSDDSRGLDERHLPSYSVLVPLYDEAEIVPDLICALCKLNYPTEKLDIQLVVESADPKTYTAIFEANLPDHFRVHVVETRPPQTKPQALNHALRSARGDIVVVYDAEDIPEPDQLRAAAAILSTNPSVGCVQCRLNIYNPSENFLTRQFTIEYTALFDCLLPALRRLGFPVPLGGTSNHFPRYVLDELGGWDPFNVTEDADLGICLARGGYQVDVLPRTTWEEAPATFAIWMKQRTRWLKGWMQTYLVHMRRPARLYQELGFRGFVGLQVFMAGALLSAIVHPWFYLVIAADLVSESGYIASATANSGALWWLGVFNLVAGYGAGIALGWAAVEARGWRRLARSSLWMPAYWLLISCAAYRALWQLAQNPYHWEKTMHRPRINTFQTTPGQRG